ncbi:DUF2283 domain-containing protein [Glaciecola sp. SC05]|uniref:DUF2283 domain-containing protein n=1 Tax=Glaciecola sp. SC05 TaxID=1987355 RepID=UPI0035291C54
MKMSYFDDSDTLYIEFKSTDIVDTKDLDENTTLDLDSNGDVVAITLEHASNRTDIGQITLSGIAA